MEEFWILILVLFFATNSLDIAECVQLEETPPKLFDEIFGEGWWDNDKAEEWHKLTLEHNLHHQIDGQNTQLGQIEANSTDQNPPLTESDPSDIAKNVEEQNEISLNENIAEDERKRKIIDKFHAIKDAFRQKRKYSTKECVQIEEKIGNHLKVSRSIIYKWKKEFGRSRKMFNEKKERKQLVEKFDQKKAELKRAGFKNSYHNQINETVAIELGITYRTISSWKRELGQNIPNKYPHSEQKELMKQYYEIKDQNPKFSDEKIAKMLKIGTVTLYRWKKQFNRENFHPNSVVGHSVEVNAAANVRKLRTQIRGVFL